jgi:hypothetical protein
LKGRLVNLNCAIKNQNKLTKKRKNRKKGEREREKNIEKYRSE